MPQYPIQIIKAPSYTPYKTLIGREPYQNPKP